MSSAGDTRPREVRNLDVAGTEALLDGYREQVTVSVYRQRGGLYELDNSHQTAARAAEDAHGMRLGPGRYHLEAVIGEKVIDGSLCYLAKWAGIEESTYEPAGHFRPSDIAEWAAEKAQLYNIEMDLDLDEIVSDSEDDPTQTNAAPSQASQPAALQGLPMDQNDVDMQDAADLASVPVSPVQAEPPRAAIDCEQFTAWPTASTTEDEDSECNDPVGVDLVEEHGNAQLCQSSVHVSKSVYTCHQCRNEALAMLDEVQREAAEQGADTILCHGCGEQHLDDLTSSFPCQCLSKTQCGRCLTDAIDRLATAREGLAISYDADHCEACSAELAGDEKVSKCDVCHGLKVRL